MASHGHNCILKRETRVWEWEVLNPTFHVLGHAAWGRTPLIRAANSLTWRKSLGAQAWQLHVWGKPAHLHLSLSTRLGLEPTLNIFQDLVIRQSVGNEHLLVVIGSWDVRSSLRAFVAFKGNMASCRPSTSLDERILTVDHCRLMSPPCKKSHIWVIIIKNAVKTPNSILKLPPCSGKNWWQSSC
jgi:hypothetical protein